MENNNYNHLVSKQKKLDIGKLFLYFFSIILLLAVCYVAFTGINKEIKNADNAVMAGRSITYDVSKDQIITNLTPEVSSKQVDSSATKEQIQYKPDVASSDILQANKEEPENIHKASHNEAVNNNHDIAQKITEEKHNQPIIAVILANVGLSSESTKLATFLPSDVTMGLTPYGSDLQAIANNFISKKHDIVINMPLEPVNYPEDDPGPYALLTSLTAQDNLERLNYITNLSSNLLGVYSLGSENFTSDSNSIKPVLKYLQDHNMIYIYAGDKANIALSQIDANERPPLIQIDYIIDEKITENSINARLEDAVKLAKVRGYAVILCNSYPLSINILKDWLDKIYKGSDIRIGRFKDIVEILKHKAN